MPETTVVWLRNDLRLADNPALHAALARGGPVVPVYIHAPGEAGEWPAGAAASVWLHESLASLGSRVEVLGGRLILLEGDSLAALEQLVLRTGADTVYWNRRYDPAGVEIDTAVKRAFKARGVDARSFKANVLFEPQAVSNKSGKPFKVFTPFWRHLRTLDPPDAPLPAPDAIAGSDAAADCGVSLAALRLLPRVRWDAGIRARFEMGEPAAAAALDTFTTTALADYAGQRDAPAEPGTSRLSPHLHFGELSPRQVWAAAQAAAGVEAAEPYLRQLAWRDFAHALLFHFPRTHSAPMDARFERFPWWREDEQRDSFRAWRRGMTGYPLVDAGMRELYQTGWMHNRVRMVAASFLVKHLLIEWQAGARWFWHTLVDADLANNSMGWQWAAGCGADAAPYFRVFNPTLQAERFDKAGAYVRRYVPELARLPDKWLRTPWRAPADVLREAGVVLEESYPLPVIEHDEGRQRALAALASLKS